MNKEKVKKLWITKVSPELRQQYAGEGANPLAPNRGFLKSLLASFPELVLFLFFVFALITALKPIPRFEEFYHYWKYWFAYEFFSWFCLALVTAVSYGHQLAHITGGVVPRCIDLGPRQGIVHGPLTVILRVASRGEVDIGHYAAVLCGAPVDPEKLGHGDLELSHARLV